MVYLKEPPGAGALTTGNEEQCFCPVVTQHGTVEGTEDESPLHVELRLKGYWMQSIINKKTVCTPNRS